MDEFHPFAKGFKRRGLASRLETHLKMVEGGEEGGQKLFVAGPDPVLLFTRHALAIVFELGLGAEETVPMFGGLRGLGPEAVALGSGKGDLLAIIPLRFLGVLGVDGAFEGELAGGL
jgi:hypothetical protein